MRLSAGSHGVGKALDGELAQLVPQAGLTSAQTDTVIPAGTAPSLAARVRRKPKSAVSPRHHDWDLPRRGIVNNCLRTTRTDVRESHSQLVSGVICQK